MCMCEYRYVHTYSKWFYHGVILLAWNFLFYDIDLFILKKLGFVLTM